MAKALRWGGTEYNSEWMKIGVKRAHKGHMKGFNPHPMSDRKRLHFSKKENGRIQRHFLKVFLERDNKVR